LLNLITFFVRFMLLSQANCIDEALAQSLKHMVGFRLIAVHDDKKLQLPNYVKCHYATFRRIFTIFICYFKKR
jgi:uncharacterized protein YutE (UPF0331/DUF86 family)